MAPRTKEQQEAYNAKRRAENAAKKAGKPTATFIVPPAHLDKIAKLAGVKPAEGRPKFNNAGPHMERQRVKKAVKKTKAMTSGEALTRKVGKGPHDALGLPLKPMREFAAKKASAKPIKGVDTSMDPFLHKATKVTKPKHDIAAQVKALGADSLLPPKKVIGSARTKPFEISRGSDGKLYDTSAAPERVNSRIPNAAMAGAYFRGGAPGLGLQRGKNFQATVTFTPEQFAELRDKALFNQRSLAEQIRWSVIQTLKR